MLAFHAKTYRILMLSHVGFIPSGICSTCRRKAEFIRWLKRYRKKHCLTREVSNCHEKRQLQNQKNKKPPELTTPLRYHLIHAGVHITPFIKPESASDHQPTKNTGFTEKLHSVYHFQTSLDSEAGMRINHSEQGNVGRRNRKPAHRYGIGSATTQSCNWVEWTTELNFRKQTMKLSILKMERQGKVEEEVGSKQPPCGPSRWRRRPSSLRHCRG